MRDTKKLDYCRVCGLKLQEPPWGEDNKSPSFDVCVCCGVEFGYEDSSLASIRIFRNNWLEQGANWSWPKAKPKDWNLDEQLKKIPSVYL